MGNRQKFQFFTLNRLKQRPEGDCQSPPLRHKPIASRRSRQFYRQATAFICGTGLMWTNAGFVKAIAQTPDLDLAQPTPTFSQVEEAAALQLQAAMAALQQRQVQWRRSPPPFLPRLVTPPVTSDRLKPQPADDRLWDRYLLGPGDNVFVNVQPPFQNLSVQSSIGPEGQVVIPLVGVVNLEGYSLNEAAAAIGQQLNRYVVNPVVSVSLLAQRPAQVVVTGQVLRPGLYPLPADSPPIAAIISAGGATLDADLRNIQVRRTLPDGRILQRQLNLYDPLYQGLPIPELKLQDGDVVSVETRQIDFGPDYDLDFIQQLTLTAPPQESIDLTVVGEVARPGYYPVSPLPAPTLVQAILGAGGSRSTADLRAIVVRRTKIDGSVVEETVDLFTPLLKGESLPEVLLEEGDVVIVPKLDITEQDDYDRQLAARSTLAQQQIRVRVLSYAAARGGSASFNVLTLPSNTTLIDAMQGISLAQADLDSIGLVRFDEELGRAITQEFDVKKGILGDATQNILLQDNDVIVVDRTLLASLSNFLNSFTQPFRDILGFLLFFDQLQRSADRLFGPGTTQQ